MAEVWNQNLTLTKKDIKIIPECSKPCSVYRFWIENTKAKISYCHLLGFPIGLFIVMEETTSSRIRNLVKKTKIMIFLASFLFYIVSLLLLPLCCFFFLDIALYSMQLAVYIQETLLFICMWILTINLFVYIKKWGYMHNFSTLLKTRHSLS